MAGDQPNPLTFAGESWYLLIDVKLQPCQLFPIFCYVSQVRFGVRNTCYQEEINFVSLDEPPGINCLLKKTPRHGDSDSS